MRKEPCRFYAVKHKPCIFHPYERDHLRHLIYTSYHCERAQNYQNETHVTR